MKFSVSSSLRTMRKSAGLSQSQLALLSGLSRNAVSSIERGEYLPSIDHALMIARVLDCHVEDIWSIDDERVDQDRDDWPCDICYRPECVGCKLFGHQKEYSQLVHDLASKFIPEGVDFFE